MKNRAAVWQVVGAVLLAPLSAAAQSTEYSNEADYLTDLVAGGYGQVVEGFEGTDWDPYRSPHEASQITSQGLTWSGNEMMTTNTGWTRTGIWGVYSAFHTGNLPEWFLVEADQTLYAAGGWFNANPNYGIDIGIEIDGIIVAERNIGVGHEFLGVIVPGGFTSVRFVDLGGEWYMGADDFTFGVVSVCEADFNGDGQVNTLDVLAFLNAYAAGDPRADFNGDGQINTLDVLAFLNAWAAGC